MINLHAEFIKKNGKPEYAILPYREFKYLREKLEDIEDVIALRIAKLKEKHAPDISLKEVKKRLKLKKICK